MSTQAISKPESRGFPHSQEDAGERRWYAAYTYPKHEKAVADEIGRRALQPYLPQYESVRHWKDRKVRLQLPLFPNYVFVKMEFAERVRVLAIPSVIHLVSFNGKPMPIPEGEIESLQAWLAVRKAEPYPYLRAGNRVKVSSGPLQGLSGTIVRSKQNTRMIVSIDSIMMSVALDVEAEDLELAA